MALKSIEQEWQDFSAKVIPMLTPKDPQYRDMQNCFFAGAFVVSMALEVIGTRSDITEEQGANYLESINREVMNHFKAIGQREVEKN